VRAASQEGFALKIYTGSKSVVAASLLLLLCSGGAFARQSASTAAPQKAASAWLHLIDTGKYGASYSATAMTFQSHLTKQQWVSAAGSVHTQVGALKSRKLMKGQEMTSLPGMPPGNYAILQYRSIFAKMPNAVETAVLERGHDKKWRINGYFVKPIPGT